MTAPTVPLRGEIWVTDCDPIRGHEQGGRRPCLVVSVNPLNRSGAALIIGVPLTTRQRQVISHIPIVPPDGGVRRPSFIMCEQVRAFARERLAERWGAVSIQTMQAVEEQLRRIQGL